MKFSELHGAKIDLIAISEDGLTDMHEYSIKPEFYRYLEYEPKKTTEETKQYLKRLIKLSNSGSGHYWFIKLKEEKKIIGTFGVINIDRKRYSAEIGFGLSPDFWGHGYFEESLMMVLEYLFGGLDFYRISAKTQFNNEPSIKALEKAGFKKEGVMRDFYLSTDGKRYDAVLLAILRGEFLRKYKKLERLKK
jgi:ribosomal-protein-alanine N-acetyltransferase